MVSTEGCSAHPAWGPGPPNTALQPLPSPSHPQDLPHCVLEHITLCLSFSFVKWGESSTSLRGLW